MTPAAGTWLALDVGGANVKAAHDDGSTISRGFPLWKRPGELTGFLADLLNTLAPFDRLALTMTAELCDCFPTKAAGVLGVLDAATAAAAGRPISVWGTDGRFHDVDSIRTQPRLAAASNWLALARVAAHLFPNGSGLLIDIGSTTSDLIPLSAGAACPVGLTDTERLRSGELVYAGVRRTPVCALVERLPHRGRPTRVAAELFATTLDVYLTLGFLPPDPNDLDTADGRPATVESARARLARMVCADPEFFGPEDALESAQAVDSSLLGRLQAAAGEACSARIGRPASAIVAGSGEFLARRLAERLLPGGAPILSLGDAWGSAASTAACARALLILARRAES